MRKGKLRSLKNNIANFTKEFKSYNLAELSDDVDLVKSIDSGYAERGRFMFNKNTFWDLVKIKDNNGRYIWQEEVRGSAPPALLGKGYGSERRYESLLEDSNSLTII